MKKSEYNEIKKHPILKNIGFVNKHLILLITRLTMRLQKRINTKLYVCGFVLYEKDADSRRGAMSIVED